MDFELSPDQQELNDLAERIFIDQAKTTRVADVEAGPDRVDHALWTTLGDAGLLGVALPEEYGGAGAGLLDLTLVLRQRGAGSRRCRCGRSCCSAPGRSRYWARRAARPVAATGGGATILTGAFNGIDLAHELQNNTNEK